MFSIQRIYLGTSKQGVLLLFLVQMLISLLWHFITCNISGMVSSCIFWKRVHSISKSQRSTYLLIEKSCITSIGNTRIYYVDHKYIIDQLPAAHSSTGCDTIGKVWTKLSLISKRLETDEEFLTYFGKQRLDSDMIADAEKFLVKVVSKKYESCDSFEHLIISELSYT